MPKLRADALSLRTIRSSSETYSWLTAEREGTLKEKPSPESIDLAIENANDSISDCTSSIGRSATSRQVEERPTSERVRVLAVEEQEDLRDLRVWRMTESGFSLFLKGRLSESESES